MVHFDNLETERVVYFYQGVWKKSIYEWWMWKEAKGHIYGMQGGNTAQGSMSLRVRLAAFEAILDLSHH